MPTYEYECQSCGRRFERRQAITEPPIALCPECGGEVRRLLSGGAGFLVRGSDQNAGRHHPGGCSLEQEGTTCCGRQKRCGQPHCESER